MKNHSRIDEEPKIYFSSKAKRHGLGAPCPLSCAPVWYFLLSVYFQSSPIQELSAMSALEYLGNPPITSDHQPRTVRVAAAQLGPIARQENREQVVKRLTALLQQAAAERCDFVVYPEMAP